jgi:hypothetical protein
MARKPYPITDAVREQHRLAGKKHGVWGIVYHGTDAMTTEQRSIHLELQEQLAEHSGIIDALREQTAQSILIARVAADYIADQTQKGVPLDEIKLLRSLPAFWNSAARMMAQLLAVLPPEHDDTDVLDLVKRYKEGEEDASDN